MKIAFRVIFMMPLFPHHYQSIPHFKNNPRYQCSLKSENIEILPILSAAFLKMAAIRMQFSSLPIN
jgi:hypothetical protein